MTAETGDSMSVMCTSAQAAALAIDQLDQQVDHVFASMGVDPSAAHALARRAVDALAADSSLGGRARHALGMTECLLGRIADGCASLTAACETLEKHGPARAACRAWRDYGSALSHLAGDTQAGSEALERALAQATELGDPHEQGAVMIRLGPLLARIGRIDEAQAMLERAVELLVTAADRSAYAGALGNLGHHHLTQGRFDQAVPLLRAELPLRESAADRLHTVNCCSNLAIALAGSGQGVEARALLARLAPMIDPARDGQQWVDYMMARGHVCLLMGDAAAARTLLQTGLAAARSQGLNTIEIDLLALLAQAEERCGDLRAALSTERALRDAERRWIDAQSASRLRLVEARMELARNRAENEALLQARAELETRVLERTAALREQMREREAAQELARFWADHDWLTRLPNRRQLQERLHDLLAQARARRQQVGVLFVDLDGFKAVNDGHGHLAGDRLLRLTSRRLVRHAPPDALVARFGGDEFVVVLPQIADATVIAQVANRLRKLLSAPMRNGGRPLRLSCSIGVAVGPRDADTPEQLLRLADWAMLKAKTAGRNQVVGAEAVDPDQLNRRSRLLRELGPAIRGGQLHAVFQPLWDLRGGRLCGVELLARWNDPVLGSVSPAEFIPLAERSGLIGDLGLWAMAQGVQAARTLRATAATRGAKVSINLSTVQLAQPRLVQTLLRAVSEAGGMPDWFELELTESVQLSQDSAVQHRLGRLRDAGFSLAIDDFGAGYSSFSYLGRAFFDRLKIDRGVINAAMHSGHRSAVTGSIIAMAHRIGMTVVAEGVETAEQMALLADQGCDIVQGYHIARPMPLDRLQQWSGPAAMPPPVH